MKKADMVKAQRASGKKAFASQRSWLAFCAFADAK